MTELERVRALCLALPEVTERLSHGSPTWFVRGKKTFVMYLDDHHGDGRLALWCAAPSGHAGGAGRRRARALLPPAVRRATAAGSACTSTAGWTGTRSRGRSRTPTRGRAEALVEQARRAAAEPPPSPRAAARPRRPRAARTSASPRRPPSPGWFIRPSEPRPSASWIWIIAITAGEAKTSRISAQWGSGSTIPWRDKAGGDERALRRRDRRVPAADRVAVVRAGVDDLVDRVVLRDVDGVLLARGEAELQHGHARQAQRLAQPRHRRGDHAEVLGDQRQLAQRLARGVERRAARAALPRALQRELGVRRHRPVGHEAAEVVDPRQVEELEDALEARDPPRVALAAQRAASRTAGCPTAGPCR